MISKHGKRHETLTPIKYKFVREDPDPINQMIFLEETNSILLCKRDDVVFTLIDIVNGWVRRVETKSKEVDRIDYDSSAKEVSCLGSNEWAECVYWTLSETDLEMKSEDEFPIHRAHQERYLMKFETLHKRILQPYLVEEEVFAGRRLNKDYFYSYIEYGQIATMMRNNGSNILRDDYKNNKNFVCVKSNLQVIQVHPIDLNDGDLSRKIFSMKYKLKPLILQNRHLYNAYFGKNNFKDTRCIVIRVDLRRSNRVEFLLKPMKFGTKILTHFILKSFRGEHYLLKYEEWSRSWGFRVCNLNSKKLVKCKRDAVLKLKQTDIGGRLPRIKDLKMYMSKYILMISQWGVHFFDARSPFDLIKKVYFEKANLMLNVVPVPKFKALVFLNKWKNEGFVLNVMDVESLLTSDKNRAKETIFLSLKDSYVLKDAVGI